jgi:lysyl-tRNA synthetase class 2
MIWKMRQEPAPPHPAPSSPSLARGAPPRRYAALALRANAYRRIREFFAERDVLEVETPIFSAAANTEPNIESFSTHFSGPLPDGGPRQRWMRTSPEFALKRLLAEGAGDCYELGRVFRDGESGRRHNPEFTMLEWYRMGWTHRELAEEATDLVRELMSDAGTELDIQRVEYRSLYRQAFGFDPFTADIPTLAAPLAGLDIRADELSRDDWLDLLMTHRLQAQFPADRLTVVFDFPPGQCALARVSGQGSDAVAERFELYLGDKELANGYHELTDAAEQRARFANDNRRRLARGQRELPIDERLLAALERGLPDCAGVALGVERLLMAMAGTDDIADVLAFAFDRA